MSNERHVNLSASELLLLFQKQWANTEDIMKITGNCYSTAAKDRKKIEEKVKDKYKDKRLPRYVVPMEEVIDYFNININYLKKISRLVDTKKDLQELIPTNQSVNLP